MRYKLCYLVNVRKRHPQRPAYIFYNSPCRKGRKRDYLRYVILAVFFDNVVYYLLPSFYAKVDIKIRHRYSFRIQKPFKRQVVYKRINVRNIQGIRNKAGRAAAAPRAYEYAIFMRKVDKVPDYKKIVRKVHVFYHRKLCIQPLMRGLVRIGHLTLKPLFR